MSNRLTPAQCREAIRAVRRYAREVLKLAAEPTADLAIAVSQLASATFEAAIVVRQSLPADEAKKMSQYELSVAAAAKASRGSMGGGGQA